MSELDPKSAVRFVHQVARLSREGAYSDATDTLQDTIATALRLTHNCDCGGPKGAAGVHDSGCRRQPATPPRRMALTALGAHRTPSQPVPKELERKGLLFFEVLDEREPDTDERIRRISERLAAIGQVIAPVGLELATRPRGPLLEIAAFPATAFAEFANAVSGGRPAKAADA